LATLHVRNFPDALYERLRGNAERNGRSIGAEAIFLLQSAALAGMTAGPPVARRRRRVRKEPGTPFEHFSPRARQVVVRAHDEARDLGSPAVGTEHLLLGLLRDTAAPVTLMLESMGVVHDDVRRAVEEAAEHGGEAVPDAIPFSPGAKKAMELALRESLDRGDGTIWPYHVLIGIAAEQEGLGAQLLAARKVEAPAIRNAVRRMMRPASHPLGFASPPGFASASDDFRVVELEGDATSWEAQLNDLAGLGYELVQIVDRRAIFSARERPPGR
jgi:ATP-dependent Clp protease ATP-binding subunit ClpC